MAIKNFEELREKVIDTPKKTVVVIAAHDPHTLEAVFKTSEEGLIDYILVGEKTKILNIAKDLKHKVDERKIIDTLNDKEAVAKGIELIRKGEADFIQKGILQTATLLKGVVNKESGLKASDTISHTALLDIPSYHKIVGITDGGMVLYPNTKQKEDILNNAVNIFLGFGYEKPKVAVLAAVETLNEKMPETVDAKTLKDLNKDGKIKNCIVEGPISLDLAMDVESSKVKKYESPVAGDADILIAPNIAAGNLMSKALYVLGGARMAGIVVGAACPIALNSRSASFEEKYFSLLACAYMA